MLLGLRIDRTVAAIWLRFRSRQFSWVAAGILVGVADSSGSCPTPCPVGVGVVCTKKMVNRSFSTSTRGRSILVSHASTGCRYAPDCATTSTSIEWNPACGDSCAIFPGIAWTKCFFPVSGPRNTAPRTLPGRQHPNSGGPASDDDPTYQIKRSCAWRQFRRDAAPGVDNLTPPEQATNTVNEWR